MKKYFKDSIKSYGYILPMALILICFYLIPLIMSFLFSFTDYNIMNFPKFIGINNYKALFKDKTFLVSLKNTVMFSIFTVPIQTILAMSLAIIITFWENKNILAKITKMVIFIPVISSMVLIGIVWRIMLNGTSSPVSFILKLFGVYSNELLGNIHTALPTLMAIHIWKNIGFFTIVYIAAIMEIPRDYYEASKVDGANLWMQIKHITIPLLKPTTIMVVFLGSIWGIQSFDLIYTLTGGGPGTATMTLVMQIYNCAFKNLNAGYGMAIANILFLIVSTITILQRKFLTRENSSI